MGWLILALLFALSLGALWLLGVRSGLLKAAAAALLVGASGYALQGVPNRPGAPQLLLVASSMQRLIATTAPVGLTR